MIFHKEVIIIPAPQNKECAKNDEEMTATTWIIIAAVITAAALAGWLFSRWLER